jgi:hypothetical protein
MQVGKLGGAGRCNRIKSVSSGGPKGAAVVADAIDAVSFCFVIGSGESRFPLFDLTRAGGRLRWINWNQRALLFALRLKKHGTLATNRFARFFGEPLQLTTGDGHHAIPDAEAGMACRAEPGRIGSWQTQRFIHLSYVHNYLCVCCAPIRHCLCARSALLRRMGSGTKLCHRTGSGFSAFP